MSLKIEIIGIGNELTTGRVLDRNAGYAAGRLSSYGFEVTRILFIPDQAKEIRKTLLQAHRRADAILVTGGLGGTMDDITAEVAAKTFNRSLNLHLGLQTQIKQFRKYPGTRLMISWPSCPREFNYFIPGPRPAAS